MCAPAITHHEKDRGPKASRSNHQPPIPLQSKTKYESGYQSSPYSNQHLAHPRREPLPGYRGQGLRVDPPHGRPIDIDDDQPSASTIPNASVTTPENNRLSAISCSGQTVTPLTASTSSPYSDRQLKNAYDRVDPLHDLSRQESRQDQNATTPQSASSTLPHILRPQMQSESPHSNPQMAAQLALQIGTSTTPTNRVRSQKEEMLAGRHYFPFDKELIHERERCNGACWRFNSSTNPNNSVFDTCEVKIGHRCNIGPNVNIYTAALPIAPKRRLGSRGPSLGRKIIIAEDCWIGGGVTILPGRTIGKGSTVGAGSIVTRVC